jgi:hypothetical protein
VDRFQGSTPSVVVALSLVDRYVRRRDAEQWAKVRNVTYRAVIRHLVDLGEELLIFFPVYDDRLMLAISEGRDFPSLGTPIAMDELATALMALPDCVTGEKSTSDVAAEYGEAVRWDLDQLCGVLRRA